MRNKFRVTMDYDPKMLTYNELMMKIAEQVNRIKGADCISVNEDDDCPN